MSVSTQMVRVQQRLTDLGLSASVFSKVCGISPAALSMALRGGLNLSGDVEKRLANLVSLFSESS